MNFAKILTTMLLIHFVDDECENDDDNDHSDIANDDKHPRVTVFIGVIHFCKQNIENLQKKLLTLENTQTGKTSGLPSQIEAFLEFLKVKHGWYYSDL